jgi:F-type H+-transporting ATPase subunit a
MAATDTLTQAASPAPVEAAKPNVFNEGFGFLGNHHELDFTTDLGPIHLGKVSLPYIFWDHGSFHVFSGEESLKESGVYTVNTDPRIDTAQTVKSSPLAEKGKAVRLDKQSIPLDLSITSNLFFMGFAMVVLVIVLRIAAASAKKSLVPKGIRNLVEVLIVFVRDDIVAENLSEPYKEALLPYFLTVFFFLVVVNLSGLLPWAHTATSSIEVTAGLALCTFVITQFVGFHAMGVKAYFKHFTAGLLDMELTPIMKGFLLIIMVPIEIMGLFTKPFALAVRLFANMTAGHIILISLVGLAVLFHSLLVGALVTVPFSLFVLLLEIFVALLQAYVFTMLSALFIGMMAHTEHEEHVQDNDLPHAPSGDHLVPTAYMV